MTGARYKIREKKERGAMRVFWVKHPDEVGVDVWLDPNMVTHCGSCVGDRVAMQRNCKHCDAVNRFVAANG